MSIGLVIGRAGSGKTRLCLDRIQTLLRHEPLGPAIFWIVPRQITFSTERLLLDTVGPHCRVRVLSFDTLGEHVLGVTGGLAMTHVSTRGRGMILGYLLRELEASLQFFRPSARRPGLAREIDRTLTEIERAGKSTSHLVDAIEAALSADPTDADTASLVGKVADLHRLHEAYTQYLGPERLDPQRKLARVLAALCDCVDFRNASVFIDGFIDFTRHERQMIVGLAKACVEVTVTLTMDPDSKTLRDVHTLPDEMSLFHRSESSTRRLRLELAEANAELRPIERLKTWQRSLSKTLAAIESCTFAVDPQRSSADAQSLHRMVAPDRAAEVDAVAREIRTLLRQGHRLRDMVVLCRDLEPYRPLVQTSFVEHGISYFLDARRSAVHHPLIRWLRGIFDLALNRLETAAVIPLLKTGLLPLKIEDVDTLETAALKLNASGRDWEHADAWPIRGFDSPESAAAAESARQAVLSLLRPFSDLLRAPPATTTVRQIAATVFALLDSTGARKTVSTWIAQARDAGRQEEAAEHEQVWSNVVELFDEMVELLGENPVTDEEFFEMLQAGLEAFDFALAPPMLDQISVGEVERLRASEASFVFVLGLSETIFPHPCSETTVLSDNDRGLLRRRSIELNDDATRRLLDERLLGYLAFTRARRRLILSRPATSDKGQRLEASVFWRQLDDLFPDAAPIGRANAVLFA